MNNSQRVAVSVKDSTAKLIMGLLVDVGIAFEYRRTPGVLVPDYMRAKVTVAARNGNTLLKVRQVIEDRQERAQVRQPEANPVPMEPTLPTGYSLEPSETLGGSVGYRWALPGVHNPFTYFTKQAAAEAAWTHAFSANKG